MFHVTSSFEGAMMRKEGRLFLEEIHMSNQLLIYFFIFSSFWTIKQLSIQAEVSYIRDKVSFGK